MFETAVFIFCGFMFSIWRIDSWANFAARIGFGALTAAAAIKAAAYWGLIP
jgi:hypothetical protein